MANFEPAYKKTMKNEGPWNENPNDTGGETYHGIARKMNPGWKGWITIDAYKKIYQPQPTKASKYTDDKFNNMLGQDQALQKMILQFYKDKYWDPMMLDKLNSQLLAENAFDWYVNNMRYAKKNLEILADEKPDLKITSDTITAINNKLKTKGELELVNDYLDAREDWYKSLNNSNFINGWLKRCIQMRNDVKISELKPELQNLAKQHIARCVPFGIDLGIHCTYVSQETDRGGVPFKIMTNDDGNGRFYHNHRLAYDCGPILGGKIDLNSKRIAKTIGPIGESLGLVWAGRSGGELSHFQYPKGLSVEDLFQENPVKSRLLGNIPGRASGGSVDSNSPYIVGEEGPELFIPSASGFILNNTALKSLLNNSKNSNTSSGWSEKFFGDWRKALKESADQMGDWSTNMQNVVATTAQSMQSTMSTVFLDAFQGKLKNFKDYFKSFANSIVQSLSSALANSFVSSIITYFTPKPRANGGPVAGGSAYLVGERGPELFVPNSSGTIVPNHQLGVGSSPQVTVNVINNSGQAVNARQETRFDGQRFVVDLWLDALSRNVGGLRDVVMAGR